ncbi:3-hydroxyacyl-ACP dehydratase FabZ family protein [Streptomyces profundus]|uniref:3-hydroxyacyl-ACP dehydratase FabZ family protein n=1 Tax=Streptomyces profundus TaxID=2867410 RepID=UPI001D15FF8D|nr:hypothetical protein [Streptomyces sp. MA3_2.13]UED85091.1 hypothetical protein K4G22_13520 [Streptomyces sp. MA3_2.13]
MPSPATPRALAGEIRLVGSEAAAGSAPQAEARIDIAADEAVFAGHYPGFPILPGVCLIECAHRAALAAFPEPRPAEGELVRLDAVESARFLDPVYPGEPVTVELAWKSVDSGWQCRAVVKNPRGVSARVRLRFPRPGTAGSAATPALARVGGA